MKNLICAFLGVICMHFVYAEDIDLFMGAQSSNNSDLPNVLIVVDNTANWSTAFTAEMGALASAVNSLEADKVRLGFMMYTETGSGNSEPGGGYVRAGVRTLTAANKNLYVNLVNSFHVTDDKSNNAKLGLTMSEVNRYFTGTAAYAGANKLKRDYTGNIVGRSATPLVASNAIYALTGNALASSSASVYQTPVTSGCQKNFVIFLSNGKFSSSNSDNSIATTHLSDVGGNTTTISLSPNGSQSEVADEWARYMASKSTNPVITYVIDVVPTVSGQYSEDYKALLKSMATAGRGKYFNVGSAGASDVGEKIRKALEQIFTEIQAVNGVFASASLPVSVNTQGTFLNQVFVGMFRPDGDAKPRWFGNLKQYQFKAEVVGSGYDLRLVDADKNRAIDSTTGFINQCARSFWTPTTADSYWSFSPQGDCSTDLTKGVSNFPDGPIVEKGAAGYRLRNGPYTPSTRKVLTCTTCGDESALTAFNSTTALDNWTRGLDSENENGNDSRVVEMRPSVHGDVVHSRPVAVNYGGTTGVVVFYGSNDGHFRAINGNQTGTTAGNELWSFVEPEQASRLNRLMANDVLIPFPSTGSANAKPYFFDGPVTAYKDNSTVWIYATQRRGGRMVYAFDVSTPSSPSLKWRRGCTSSDDTSCSTGFTAMGQTWSSLQVFKAAGYGSGATPMVVFGGGYSTCEDSTTTSTVNNTCGSGKKGNVIYVLDASTGALLTSFPTDRSVVGDVTLVRNKTTGLAEYAYAADTGGNVYRIGMASGAPATWALTKIAALGCNTPGTTPCTGTSSSNRKFLFGPSVVVTSNFNAVLLGSGDREHPLSSHAAAAAVPNHFYMLKDKPTVGTWLSDESANCTVGALCLASLYGPIANTSSSKVPPDLGGKKGWYMTLSSSEQVVTSSITLFGETTFSTHRPLVPSPGTCSANLGEARVYNVSYLTSEPVGNETSRFETISGGGLPPSPVAGMVTVDDPNDDGTKTITVPFIIGARPESPLEVKLKSGASAGTNSKERVYWYIRK